MEKFKGGIFLLNTIAMNTSQMPKPDFLDILFDSRNKAYGAYDLRRKYDRRVRNAVAGMAGIVLLSIGAYAWASNSKASDIEKPYVKPIELDNVKLPPAEEKVIPPPTRKVEPPPAARTMVKHTIFKVVENDKVKPEDEVKKMDELKDVSIGHDNIKGSPDGPETFFDGPTGPGGGVVEAPKVEKEEGPLSFVEINPEYPGGQEALYKFLNNNMHYPAMASENGIEGTVFVKFVVNADGSITDVAATGNKLGAGCEEEAIRVIRKMPKWKPGRQNGRNVAVWFNVPIRFKLNQ
ncbi:energy transducer TonB [Chitinophaga deserti]|uniref:energy transducer TonB n=1 Tax=Chitinophaga deserti TaxID=2164099 RepID=UPI000D6B1F70|nr:energy transducer TonB [Chitinophaga deserti]